MTLTGTARVAGIMGWPVGHSRSPRLHNFWIETNNLDGVYIPLPVRPEGLGQALAALPGLGFRGVNLTVPHKQAALAAMDTLDAAARRIGAVNTVVVGADGRLEGSNTDGFGFLENLRQSAPDFDCGGGPAVVIGAGGAARAVVAGLLDAGAPAVRIVNRTVARAEALAADLGGACTVCPLGEIAGALAGATLLVNATTLGMTGQPGLDIDLAGLPPGALVNDIVYAPLETPLLAAARARGNPTVDGLGMLLHQGRPGFEAWFGVDPKVTDALRAAVLGEV